MKLSADVHRQWGRFRVINPRTSLETRNTMKYKEFMLIAVSEGD